MKVNRLLVVCFTTIFLFLFSCKSSYEKYTYYDNGSIHEKFVFPTKEDKKTMKNYEGTLFYPNGNIKYRIRKKNGLTQGEYITYYEQGTIRTITMYDKDTIHGVHKGFSDSGELVEESLYLKGEHLFKMEAYNANSHSVNFYYFIEDNAKDEIGRIIYKSSGELDTLNSFYYLAEGPDTISFNEKYCLHVSIYTFDIKNYIKEAVFGEFDKTFEIRDSTDFAFLNSENNHLTFCFKPSKKGRNFVVGKIHVQNLPFSKEELDRDFIVFKDFFVR
ncbi:MAG: hypothetical protein RBT74_08425 [Tenuifilaceae bacterium]|nr:hypothetical protein [Tenuifilaceae bacterium]